MDTQRINICDEDASFECTIRFPPVGFSEFKEYVEEFECKLLYLIYEDEDEDSEGEEKVIGKLHGYRFSLYDCYQDYDEDKEDALLPLDILDMIDDNVARLMCLFEDASYIKPKYFKKWQNILDLDVPEITPNIILINRVEVLAEYRGRRFGELLISNSLYTISRRNDLVIVDAMPLQFWHKSPQNKWEEEMRLGNLEKDKKKARKTLNEYYEKLGFKQLTKDGLLFLALPQLRL